jgi:Mrp family chromosome partitioning ATPase
MHSIRRLWWLVGLGVAAGIAGGFASMEATVPVYAASARVLIEPIAGTPLNLSTEAELVRSTQTVHAAQDRLHDPAAALPTVEAVPGASVLEIEYRANTAEGARAGAAAYAEAYLAGRAGTARTAINDGIAWYSAELSDATSQIAEQNAILAGLPSNSADAAAVQAKWSSLNTYAGELANKVSELRGTTVNPGRVILEAERPSAPVWPLRWAFLAAGGLAGGLLGLALGLVWRRWPSRVRGGADLDRHAGITVLADLPAAAIAVGTTPQHPSARAFNRLRNEVVASLGQADRILLVTGASPGCASMMVAANLAAALARADNDVVLVGASVPELSTAAPTTTTTLAQIFDVADIPGLTDVLSGRTSLASAVQRAARSPRLRIVTPGGTASATGLLQSEGARGVLAALARRVRYVVVEAPSTASGADAQSLASAADAAVLVVETGQTRHSQVGDAATQLCRVGTRLLGTVVVPRLQPRDLEASRDALRSRNVLEFNTETWVGAHAALEAPTSKLEQVPRREIPVPHDQVDAR